ncbi:putative integral membrane protein [Desulfitispora alkaliphila]
MVTNYLVWIVIILLAILVITFGIWNNTKEILQEVKEVKKHMGS